MRTIYATYTQGGWKLTSIFGSHPHGREQLKSCNASDLIKLPFPPIFLAKQLPTTASFPPPPPPVSLPNTLKVLYWKANQHFSVGGQNKKKYEKIKMPPPTAILPLTSPGHLVSLNPAECATIFGIFTFSSSAILDFLPSRRL